MLAGGFVVLVLVLAAALVARLRLWTARRAPAAADSAIPDGSVLGGADVLAVPAVAFAAQLIDWHVRGVVSVGSRGPVEEHDTAHGVSGGPRWIITLRDAAGIREDERMALAGLFDDGAGSGAVFQLEQRDQESRGLLGKALDLARGVRRDEWGPRRPVHLWLSRTLMVLAVASAVAVIVTAFTLLAEIGAGGLAGLAIPAALLAAATVALAARPSLPSEQELRFSHQVRALEEFIRTADRSQVTTELLGWAMLVGMPLPWSRAVPPALAAVVEHPASFRMIPRPNGWEYTG